MSALRVVQGDSGGSLHELQSRIFFQLLLDGSPQLQEGKRHDLYRLVQLGSHAQLLLLCLPEYPVSGIEPWLLSEICFPRSVKFDS